MNENMNLKITVDDGSRRVPIVNTDGDEIGSFKFRPTDIGIVQRFNAMTETFGQITEPLERLPDDASDADRLKAVDEAEKRLYAAVNELFDGDAAGAFFSGMKPFSPVNGAFYCEQVLSVVGQFIADQFNTETAKFEKRVSKYTKRVNKK